MTAEVATAATAPAAPTSPTQAPATEGSMLGRFVALLTPIFAIGAGWLAGVVAKHTGAKLDQGQLVAFMAAAVTAVLATGLKWLHGWQQHERLVVQSGAQPLKPATDKTAAANSSSASMAGSAPIAFNPT